MSVKWVISDQVNTYTFEISPRQKKANAELNYRKDLKYQAQLNAGPIVMLGQTPIFEITMEGTSLSQTEYTQLWFFYNDTTIVTITDDLGRTYQGYITDFAPKRVRKPDYGYIHDWSMKMLLSSVTDV